MSIGMCPKCSSLSLEAVREVPTIPDEVACWKCGWRGETREPTPLEANKHPGRSRRRDPLTQAKWGLR